MALCDECIKKEICNVSKFFTGNYGNGLPLVHCKHFIGKAPQEIKTNFQRITATPEALAELMQNCVNCDDCPITDKRVCEDKYESCKEAWLEWLKQESR